MTTNNSNPTDDEHAKARLDSRAKEDSESKHAADLIRQKLSSIYEDEPSVKQETSAVARADKPLSKHQLEMQRLNSSGKTLAQIQTAWHEYYDSLSDKEKHEVWQEFYATNKEQSRFHRANTTTASHDKAQSLHQPHARPVHHEPAQQRSVSDVKQQLLYKKHPRRKLKAKQHFQSVLFGLGVGSFVMLFLLFGFFNERFITPFITPSRQVSSTPIIADGTSVTAGPNPEIIIPKINVEIPVVYNEPSIEEDAIQKALERGVVHYATTVSPGEKGNAVIFGHSSNNIFNPGKYKFAFVLLSRLENDDLFYLTKGGKRYTYRVYKKTIVDPSEVSVLGSAGKTATATLITCDPPGTTLKRLVVIGEQINPSPTTNKNSTASSTDKRPTVLPSNAPSLWQRLINWF